MFDETLSNLKKMDAQIEEEWGYSQLTMGVGKHGDVESTREIAIAEIRDRYAAALPDDLPVIPKAVGDAIKIHKDYAHSLLDIFGALSIYGVSRTEPSLDYNAWIVHHPDTFARAWLLGAWCVEESGEIVKLSKEEHDG